MSSKFIIGVDLDGVVIDHTAKFKRLAKEFEYTLTSWQTNSNVFKHVVLPAHATTLKSRVYFDERGNEPAYPGVKAVLQKIGHVVHIISVQKDPRSEKKLWPWLKKNGILDFVPRSRITIVRSREEKIRVIKALRPNFFIDDGLDVLDFVPAATRPVLFDPVNVRRFVQVNPRITVVSHWKEAERVFLESK